ncbi:hypothetical protein ACVWXN_003121 [Bradyrhizobium sp. i1.4.4]
MAKPPHLIAAVLAERQRDADPVQAVLLLPVHADMRHAVRGWPRRKRLFRHARERRLQPLLDKLEEAVMTHGIEHVFQPRLVAVGAIAMIDEHAHDGVGDGGGLLRLDDDVGVFCKVLVAGDAAEAEAEPDTGLDAKSILHLERGEGDVVGFLQHRDPAGAVEGDVELARQAVERAIVEDVVVPLTRIGARVDQFLRVDAGRRRPRHVADVVGARAARAQAEVLDALDQPDRILRRDLAELEIGARRDVTVRAAEIVGEIGKAGQLPVLHDAVRDAQPAHVGVLRRRDVEDAVIAPAEIVRRARRRVVERLLPQSRIGIERMLVALELLLVGELLAGCDDLVLRLDVDGVGARGLGIGLAGAAAETATDPADLQTGREAFEIAFLLVGKVD